MEANPKTAAALQKNTRILNALNQNHEDDILAHVKVKNPIRKSETVRDIMAELEIDSDSDNEISMSSARTPVGYYLPGRRRISELDEEKDEDKKSNASSDLKADG